MQAVLNSYGISAKYLSVHKRRRGAYRGSQLVGAEQTVGGLDVELVEDGLPTPAAAHHSRARRQRHGARARALERVAPSPTPPLPHRLEERAHPVLRHGDHRRLRHRKQARVYCEDRAAAGARTQERSCKRLAAGRGGEYAMRKNRVSECTVELRGAKVSSVTLAI
eukprot:1323861-Pleurochrysis_carterae.AAC.3